MFEYLTAISTANYELVLKSLTWALGIIGVSFLVACTLGAIIHAGKGNRPELPDDDELSEILERMKEDCHGTD
jgi:hypothetical protein